MHHHHVIIKATNYIQPSVSLSPSHPCTAESIPAMANLPKAYLMSLVKNPMGMFFFIAAADVQTATNVSGDNFKMFSVLKVSGSVMADIATVNAIEHKGPQIGMKLRPSAVMFLRTSKTHVSYVKGVPKHVRYQASAWLAPGESTHSRRPPRSCR